MKHKSQRIKKSTFSISTFGKKQKKIFHEARSRGLVVKADDSQSRGCGFEPRRRILDGMQASYCIVNKEKIKVAKWGTPKKKKYLVKKKNNNNNKKIKINKKIFTCL